MAEMKETTCPVCKLEQNDATPQAGQDPAKRPKAGDWTICARCASILEWKPDMTFRQVTPEEIRRLAIEKPREHAALMEGREFVKSMNLVTRYGTGPESGEDPKTIQQMFDEVFHKRQS